MIRKLAVLGFSTLLVVGCGQDETDSAASDSSLFDASSEQSDVAATLFDRVDADTALLIANLEPIPEDLSEKLWAPLRSMSDFNSKNYNEIADELDEVPVAAAILREFAKIDGAAAFAERGLDPNGHWAMHAVSLYPFIHWQLSDAEAFRATLERIAADAETELNWRQIEDREVLWAELEDVGVALSYDDRFATLAVVPENDTLLRRVANLDQPTRAYDPADLESFADERGYTPYGSGFMDFGRLINQLLDSDEEMLASVRESTELGEIAGNPACRSELNALVALFPRASLGYTEVSDNRMAFDMTVEADPAFAQRMQTIADTPIDLDRANAGVIEFGLALNIVGTRDFAREMVGGWVESPPQCPLFSSIGAKAGEWQTALNQPIPPVVTNFHGLRLNLESLSLDDQSNVQSAEGSLALFMRNPQMMLGMAQMFSPELAAIQLQPGGEPQPVPAGVIPNLPEGVAAFIGMSDAALGLAVGEGQKGALNDAMEPGDSDGAVFSYGINFAGYADALGELMAGMQEQMQAMGEEPAANPAEALDALAELYDYTEASMHLTERGIEFRSTVTLKD